MSTSFFANDRDGVAFYNSYKTNNRHSHGLSNVTNELSVLQLWPDSWSSEGVYVMTPWAGTHWKHLRNLLSKLPEGTVLNYVMKSRKHGVWSNPDFKVKLIAKTETLDKSDSMFIFQKV